MKQPFPTNEAFISIKTRLNLLEMSYNSRFFSLFLFFRWRFLLWRNEMIILWYLSFGKDREISVVLCNSDFCFIIKVESWDCSTIRFFSSYVSSPGITILMTNERNKVSERQIDLGSLYAWFDRIEFIDMNALFGFSAFLYSMPNLKEGNFAHLLFFA